MRLPTSLRWVGLALLGLVIAAAIAIAASHLASQQIGIASESVSAGDSLAPPVTATHKQRHEVGGGRATEAGEGQESTAKPKALAEESEPGVTEAPGEGEVPAAPIEPTESSESEPPATVTPSEPRSDDTGGGEGNDGGGRDD